jgi:uncharacterized protein (TIGR03085 family)
MTRALLARRERLALCDLALVVGEDAPTLCGDWTAKELVVHLLLREYDPIAAAGLVVPPLSKVTDLRMAMVGRKDFGVLVERLRRRGPTVFSLPPVDRMLNTLEYFVHHEDVRRAQPTWAPRSLAAEDEDAIWTALRYYGRGLVRDAGVPVRIRRTDTGATATLRRGSDPVLLSGLPSELALHLFGRRAQARGVAVDGPEDRVAQLRAADLGI